MLSALAREQTASIIDLQVLAYLGALASNPVARGEAWPRPKKIAAEIGRHVRLVERAIDELQKRGMLTSRLLRPGAVLPDGQHRVVQFPLRVFRIHPEGKKAVKSTPIRGSVASPIPRSEASLIPGSGATPIPRSGPPYDPDRGEEIDLRRRQSSETARARATGKIGPKGGEPPLPANPPEPPDESEKDDALGSSALGAEGASITFGSSHDDDDRELGDVPPSGVLAVAARAELGGSSDETDFEQVGATSSTSRHAPDPGRLARRVIEAWRDELEPDIVGPLFTRERRELVRERLREGFTVDQLAALFAWAKRSTYFREHAGRRSLTFLLADRDRLLGWLPDATRARVSRGVSRRPGAGTSPPGTPPTEKASTGRLSSAGPQSGASPHPQPTPEEVRAAREALARGELPPTTRTT